MKIKDLEWFRTYAIKGEKKITAIGIKFVYKIRTDVDEPQLTIVPQEQTCSTPDPIKFTFDNAEDAKKYAYWHNALHIKEWIE